MTDNYFPLIGGVANHIFQLCRALTALGCKVHLLSFTIEGAPAEQNSSPFPVTWSAPWVRNMGLFRGQELALRAVRVCTEIMEAENLQLVHFHTRGHLSKALRKLNAPKVFTNHTSRFLRFLEEGKNKKLGSEVDHADAFIAPSEQLVEALAAVGVAEDKISYISNGVDSELYCPGEREAAKVRLGLPAERVCILCARRVVEKNGIEFLAQALPKVEGDFVFLMVGDRPESERSPYESRVCAELSKLPQVRFMGEVPSTEMPDIYKACEISVVPSLVEATSLTCLESMSTECAVLATNVGGLSELLEHGRSGLLVEPRSPEALTQGLNKLLADKELRNILGQQARQVVMDGFQWKDVAVRTIEVYDRLLEAKGIVYS